MVGFTQANHAISEESGFSSGGKQSCRKRSVWRDRGALAPSLAVDVRPINVRDDSDLESALAAFARSPNSGLIVAPSVSSTIRVGPIVSLAAKYKLPAVYGDRFVVALGGLMSYGPDRVDAYGRAAAYVDRILKGEKPANLPVQAPTKIELVINLKTARNSA